MVAASAPPRRQLGNAEVRCAVAFTATCALLAAACATPGKGSTPIVSGEVLRGDKGGYELRIPTGEWSKVAPGTLNPESQADLELVRSGYSAWLSVKRTSGSAMRIEQFVYGRRSQFLAGGATHYRERRFFLANDHLVPASLARYRNGSQIFLILTALKGQLAIEVLGLVQRGRGVETELLEILESVRFLEEESPL